MNDNPQVLRAENAALREEIGELKQRIDSLSAVLDEIPSGDIDTMLTYLKETIEYEVGLLRRSDDCEGADEFAYGWQQLFTRMGRWLEAAKQQQRFCKC